MTDPAHVATYTVEVPVYDDDEIQAMAVVAAALRKLDVAASDRVLWWVRSRSVERAVKDPQPITR